MTWFLLAVISPFLYAITNYIDKILLQKYFKEGGVGTLILFSALLSALAIPIIYFIDPTVLEVSLYHIGILVLVGIFGISILWCYLMAMEDEEPSIVIVFYQLVPVFALGLGYLLLGETLSTLQLTAMGIIIFGTTLISFEIDDENNFNIKRKTVFFMTLAAFFWASESVLFKFVALEENVWRSLFWEHVVLMCIGLLLLVGVKHYREQFVIALKNNSKPIIGLNVINESIYMVGNVVVALAVMLAPVALILLAQPFQSFFVLIIGIVLTKLVPQIYREDTKTKHVAQKILAIVITGIGTYMLLSVT